MKKSTVVIADRLLCDGQDIGDYVKMTLPELKWKTDTLTGAGVGGDIDVPLYGLADPMSCQIDLRSVSAENAARMMSPGTHKIEARFNRNVMRSDGEVIKAGTKVFLSGFSTGLSAGSIQRGSAMEGNCGFSVYRYRWVEDGRELFLIDQSSERLVVNGRDYSDALQV